MFLLVCSLIAASILPTWQALVCFIVLELLAALLLGIFSEVLDSWKTVGVVCLSLLVVYAWAYPGSTDFIFIFGVQGFLKGLLIAVRLLAFVTAMYLMLIATGPVAITRWAGDINEDFGIIVSLTLGVIPAMKQSLDVTMQAQQVRGLATEGSVILKLKAYLALIIPVIVKSLIRAYQMAALMHVRGYGSTRRIKAGRASLSFASYAVYGAGAGILFTAVLVSLAVR